MINYFRIQQILMIILVIVFTNGCLFQTTKLEDQLRLQESRIIALEKAKLKSVLDLIDDMKNLKKEVGKKQEEILKKHLFFLEQLDKIKNDLKSQTSQSEQTNYQLKKIQKELQRLKKHVGDQVIALSELQHIFQTDLEQVTLKNKKEREAYQRAIKFFKARQLDQAYNALIKFRNNYPKSDYYDDAIFYIAYTQLLQKRYENATLHFYDLLEQFPQSNKYNETQWWLAVTLEHSGDLNAAKDIYRKMLKIDKKNIYYQKAQNRLDELK